MKFDFTSVPQRLGTDSQKWQKYEGQATDILPMWVADMDFVVAPAITAAINTRAAHGIFGYARPTAETTRVMLSAMERNYGWTIDPSWIVWLPGLVCGLNITARAFAEPDDEVLTLAPIYPPFMTAPRNGGRKSVQVFCVLVDGQWTIDWAALEAAITPRTKLFYLCNPHNPLARVWRREELTRLAALCLQHNIVLCSDEIHCDLILDESLPHIPTATLSTEIAQASLTLMAPSKTYNIPGLGTSFAIIPNPTLRARFNRAASGIMAEVNCLGYVACEAAYGQGEPWRQELLATLRANRDSLIAFVRDELPGVSIEAPIEATYLAWLNVKALGLADPIAHFEAHGIGLSDGAYFGAPKGDYVRINFGCPPATLAEGLARMKTAVAAI